MPINITQKAHSLIADYFKDRRIDYAIDATNNYYDTTPVASKFLGANWEPCYAEEDDVPEYVEKENSYKITYVLNGGVFGSVSYEVTIEGAPISEVEIGAFYTDGLEPKAPIVICEPSIVAKNSLRWQYKIILKYDEAKQAYLVVAVDAQSASTNNAAGGAENWTHAIASASENVTTLAAVGQYIVIDAELAEGMAAFQAKVYDAAAISSTEKKTTIEHADKYTASRNYQIFCH